MPIRDCAADGLSNSYPPTPTSLMGGAKTSACITPVTGDGLSSSIPATAEQIARRAAELTGGDRAYQHGADKAANHRNIADLWNAYLRGRMILGQVLAPQDVALMMALLKIARTKMGTHNVDDYIDGAGYMAVAGEIAERAK